MNTRIRRSREVGIAESGRRRDNAHRRFAQLLGLLRDGAGSCLTIHACKIIFKLERSTLCTDGHGRDGTEMQRWRDDGERGRRVVHSHSFSWFISNRPLCSLFVLDLADPSDPGIESDDDGRELGIKLEALARVGLQFLEDLVCVEQ